MAGWSKGGHFAGEMQGYSRNPSVYSECDTPARRMRGRKPAPPPLTSAKFNNKSLTCWPLGQF
jgi:hypothetical protein